MKALNVIVKILTALAAVAGVIYVIATYGDDIVAWAKSILHMNSSEETTAVSEQADIVDAATPSVESADEADTVAATENTDDTTIENAPIADENDFEG